MSMAAVWRTGCCKRLFVQARFRGNEMWANLRDCEHCRALDLSPRKQVAADFVNYVDDARLITTDVRMRFLTGAESKLLKGSLEVAA